MGLVNTLRKDYGALELVFRKEPLSPPHFEISCFGHAADIMRELVVRQELVYCTSDQMQQLIINSNPNMLWRTDNIAR
jgi:hypothetical protein